MENGFSPMGGASSYGVEDETLDQMKASPDATSTSTGIDTGGSFWGDVMEMGLGGQGGARVSPMRANAGSMPRSSAPQAFKASNGNIAHILKMFSPYQGGK